MANGWTNWDTWNANLYLAQSDEFIYQLLLQCPTHDHVESLFRQAFGDNFDEIDISKVNWQEIFENKGA